MPIEYYIENKERGCVGNSIQWWKWNDNGYTCDVIAARKFSEAEARTLVVGRNKYAMWEVDYIDNLVQHHIDVQDLVVGRTKPHTLNGVE